MPAHNRQSYRYLELLLQLGLQFSMADFTRVALSNRMRVEKPSNDQAVEDRAVE